LLWNFFQFFVSISITSKKQNKTKKKQQPRKQKKQPLSRHLQTLCASSRLVRLRQICISLTPAGTSPNLVAIPWPSSRRGEFPAQRFSRSMMRAHRSTIQAPAQCVCWKESETTRPDLVFFSPFLFDIVCRPAKFLSLSPPHSLTHFKNIFFISHQPHGFPTRARLARALLSQRGAAPPPSGGGFLFYDNLGVYSCTRTAWVLRALGGRAGIIEGGLSAFEAAGGTAETTAALGDDPAMTELPHCSDEEAVEKVFGPAHALEAEESVRSRVLARIDEVAAIARGEVQDAPQLIDARTTDRFEGRGEERPGLRHGRVPGARSVPYSAVLAQDGTFLRGEPLRAVFERAGVDLARSSIVSCGSGVNACVIATALELAGMPLEKIRIYDGSWAQYGASDHPIANGPQ
jgi:thiosulfate/3-mercaptopyruvate sulfurtransferase